LQVPIFAQQHQSDQKLRVPIFPQQQEIRPQIASPDVSTTTTMRPQIASPNVYRQQSERTSQIHIKTVQIGCKVFFSFPFFLGEFSHCGDKSFWKWGVEVHNVLLQNPWMPKKNRSGEFYLFNYFANATC
jgi:hypothetical protein